MIDEYVKWFEQAEEDYDTAKYNIDGGKFKAGAFFLQQSTEKALKAVYIKKFNNLLKIHDLVLLAKKIKAPEEVIILCSKLNPLYIDTRYPNLEKKLY